MGTLLSKLHWFLWNFQACFLSALPADNALGTNITIAIRVDGDMMPRLRVECARLSFCWAATWPRVVIDIGRPAAGDQRRASWERSSWRQSYGYDIARDRVPANVQTGDGRGLQAVPGFSI